MVSGREDPVPTRIDLHTASRVLEVRFEDGRTFNMPCEYLRVFSPSAEARVAESRGEILRDKEHVNIMGIEPVGNYAVRLAFDDGHDTGVFSWKTLYELGRDYEQNWNAYVSRRDAATRETRAAEMARVRVLYFAQLAERLEKEAEAIQLTPSERDIKSLLSVLRRRGGEWERSLADDTVKVTVNKRFADGDSPLEDGDEVAIVPARPS